MFTRLKRARLNLTKLYFIQQLLNRFDLNNVRPVTTPIDPNKELQLEISHKASKGFQKRYQSMTGLLNYLAMISRMDMAFAISAVLIFDSSLNTTHVEAVQRMYVYWNVKFQNAYGESQSYKIHDPDL